MNNILIRFNNILNNIHPEKGLGWLISSKSLSPIKVSEMKPITSGQTFCDWHTCLHLFYCITRVIRKGISNCSSIIQCHFMHTLSYHFLQTYVKLSPSNMNNFSLRDLHTFNIQPYLSIMFRNSLLYTLMR